jgi:hypothetical protein
LQRFIDFYDDYWSFINDPNARQALPAILAKAQIQLGWLIPHATMAT